MVMHEVYPDASFDSSEMYRLKQQPMPDTNCPYILYVDGLDVSCLFILM